VTWALTHTQRLSERQSRRVSFMWCDAIVSLVVITTVVLLLTQLQGLRGRAEPVLTIAIVWLVLTAALWLSDIYSRTRRSTGQILLRIVKVSIIVAAGILVVEALVGSMLRDRIPPLMVILGLTAAALSLVAYRVAIACRQRDERSNAERVIVVGTGALTEDIVRRLERSGGSDVLGLVDDDQSDLTVLGSIEQLPELCSSLDANRVLVAFPKLHAEELLPILRALPNSVSVDVVPRYFELVGWGARLEDFSGLSLVALRRRCDPARRDRIKRAFDVVIAAVALVVVSPVLIMSAIVIACTSGRPILFRQERLGRRRTPFRIAKLRTLREPEEVPVESDAQPVPQLHSEIVAGRTTRVGRVLRRTGIDELPQLLNVLAGQMSLVGPRPFIPEECRGLTGLAERRFDVRPGMTGLWQVSGQHDLSYEELIRLDTYYVDTWTFWSDLRILAMTPARLWRGGGDGVPKLALEPWLEPSSS
jgi:exopolysaccharide biosynthesis polyprenyl glycosylphosphotransferase